MVSSRLVSVSVGRLIELAAAGFDGIGWNGIELNSTQSTGWDRLTRMERKGMEEKGRFNNNNNQDESRVRHRDSLVPREDEPIVNFFGWKY